MRYLLLCIFSISLVYAKPIILDAKIKSVTVYTNRAQITKESEVKVDNGKYIYIFEKIPANIDFNSIQVSALGDIGINDIIIKKKFTTKILEGDVKTLNTQKQQIHIKLSKLKDAKKRVSKQNTLVNNIINSFTKQSSQKDNNNTIDVNKWIEVLNFQETQLAILDDNMQNFIKEEKNLRKKLNHINNQLNQYSRNKHQYFYNVSVSISSDISTNVKFKLSYITYNARWIPSYDIKANVEKKRLNIIYNAKIIQNSGEDWDKVKVKLSTAKPSISGNIPTLRPIYVQKLQIRRYKEEKNMVFSEAVAFDSIEMKKNSSVKKLKMKPRARFQKVKVKNNFASVLFELSQSVDIPSDNAYHKVNIMNNSYKTKFTYESVPKLSLYAYLKATIKNDGKYPLLAGKANIYENNVFLAKSNIPNITKNGKFHISLGIDENIKIEYKNIKSFDKEDGFVNKEKIKSQEYLITVHNKRDNNIDITILDQFPISTNEDIKIKLINPKRSKIISISKQNIIKWNLHLNANQKLNLPLKYEVIHPSDMNVHQVRR